MHHVEFFANTAQGLKLLIVKGVELMKVKLGTFLYAKHINAFRKEDINFATNAMIFLAKCCNQSSILKYSYLTIQKSIIQS